MDSAYLKENVGPALTAAMTAMIVEQPKDSVEVSYASEPPPHCAKDTLPTAATPAHPPPPWSSLGPGSYGSRRRCLARAGW